MSADLGPGQGQYGAAPHHESGAVPADRAVGLPAHLFALAGFLLLAVLVTWPAVRDFATQVPGDLIADRDQNLWNLWWTREAIARPTNPFQTDLLYYPYGAPLYYHTLALPLGLIGLLPQALLGLPAAYNTVLLVAFTLGGYGAFRLALYALRGRDLGRMSLVGAAFLGGLVFAFTPYTLDALKGQPEVLSLQWMPFFAEGWLRATDSARRGALWWTWAVGAGVFFALAAYSSLYYALYLVVFALVHLAYMGIVSARERKGAAFTSGGQVAVVAGVIGLVIALPLLEGLWAGRDNPRLAVEADPAHRLAHSADLLSFFAPPHDHPLGDAWRDRPGVNEPPIHDYVMLGYVAFALAVLGGVVAWKRPGTPFWVGLGLVALVLAMGPRLQVARNVTGIPLPFALLDNLPGMDAIAKPERFVVLARLAMGVLAAGGAGRLLSSAGSVRARSWRVAGAWGLALALLLAELPIHPRYVEPLDTPAGYAALASMPRAGMMELPFATQQVEVTGPRMRYQTTHHKPVMSGYLARRYDSPIIDFCSPFWGFISPIDVPSEGEDIASPLVASRPLDVLSFYDIGYVALYGRTGNPQGGPVDAGLYEAHEAMLEEVAPGPPLYADDYVRVQQVREHSLADAPASFHVGRSWYPIEQAEGEPFRWLKDGSGTMCVFAPRPVTAALVMDATSFATARTLQVSVGGQTIYSGTVQAGGFGTVRSEPVEWQAGVTEVSITAVEGGTTPRSLDPNSPDERPLSVGFKRVQLDSQARR